MAEARHALRIRRILAFDAQLVAQHQLIDCTADVRLDIARDAGIGAYPKVDVAPQAVPGLELWQDAASEPVPRLRRDSAGDPQRRPPGWQTFEVTERKPQRVTTDQHPPYRRAIRWILGRKVVHRTNPYLNNLTEQDHRAVKQRYYPMLGFGSFASAARFCSAFEELRQYLRARGRRGEVVPPAEQRRRFVGRWHALIAEMAAA